MTELYIDNAIKLDPKDLTINFVEDEYESENVPLIVPDISFELETFLPDEEAFDALMSMLTFGNPINETITTDVKIVVKGKRIWWKPWRRRPDKEYNFSDIEVSTKDGVNYEFRKANG